MVDMEKGNDGTEKGGQEAGAPRASAVLRLDKDKLLKSVLRLNTYLTPRTNVQEILARILDEIVDSIGFDKGIIRLLDPSRQNLETRAVKNYSPEETRRAFATVLNIQQHDCIATRVARSGQPIAIEVAGSDPRIGDIDRKLTNIFDRGSYLCAPLKIGDEVIGTVAAWFKQEIRFHPEEISLFLTYASTLSMIIHNSRLFKANAEKIRQFMILQEAVSEMNASYVLGNRILEVLVASALRIAGADKGQVSLLDFKQNLCLINEGAGLTSEAMPECEERIQATLIRRAIDGDGIVIGQQLADRRDLKLVFPGCPVEIAFPMVVGERFRGALLLAKKEGEYPQDKINILDILVKNGCSSYDNAMLHALLSQEAKTLKTEVEKLKEREDLLLGFENILGKSKKMIRLFRVIAEVAGHDTHILIQGESGTGKELIARAIHRKGKRSDRPFVDVNCAAIPGTLLESELFGYEAGAFTDARKRKIGLLEYAHGGTMLLDEIGEMDIHLQAKFLRMLEDGHIRRLGGTENVPIDVRFIFSTNRNLAQMVTENRFRQDLFYRISVVPIMIPPLRERIDDLMLLANHYVEEFNRKFQKKVRGFTAEAQQVLTAYRWPGNVRELKNIIERTMILHDEGTMITFENLPSEIKAAVDKEAIKVRLDDHILPQLSAEKIDFKTVTERIFLEIKRRIIENVLEASRGNRTVAAKRLGISRYKLIREMKKIERPSPPDSGSVEVVQ